MIHIVANVRVFDKYSSFADTAQQDTNLTKTSDLHVKSTAQK